MIFAVSMCRREPINMVFNIYIVKHDRLTLVGLYIQRITLNSQITRSTIDSHLDRSVNSDSVKSEFNG